MPQLEYFLVCESISTDRETNRVSLFNVLEDLQIAGPGTAPQQPRLLSQFVAVSCWNKEEGDEARDYQLMLRIHVPGEEPKEFSMNFIMERPRHRLSLGFQGIPNLEPGQLRFELLLNSEHVAWHTVNVFPPPSDTLASENTTAE